MASVGASSVGCCDVVVVVVVDVVVGDGMKDTRILGAFIYRSGGSWLDFVLASTTMKFIQTLSVIVKFRLSLSLLNVCGRGYTKLNEGQQCQDVRGYRRRAV